jgi:TonB family protein
MNSWLNTLCSSVMAALLSSLAFAQSTPVIAIDKMMTAEELKSTGVDTLTRTQLSALNRWLSEYTVRLIESAQGPDRAAPASVVEKTAGGKVASAQVVYRKEPEYPMAARQMGAHGQVVLEATIGTDGRVIGVRVISAGHPLLVQTAKDAVMQWRYSPTLLDGQPVENTTQITLTFSATR